ncbi:uncharacterized protein LOC103834374 [Brassica rapa]|uniref:uncharacterized protein LOC103834374 n=1 Tax=Brassica campestris TaxID=3711 RepID=UPI00142DC1E0|nr:uncharacterized protein LOC103834374 [Brassica rapa]
MANVLALLSDLQTGRSSSTVEVRLLRFWEARNVRRCGELMGVDMLLIDSQVICIHGNCSPYSEPSYSLRRTSYSLRNKTTRLLRRHFSLISHERCGVTTTMVAMYKKTAHMKQAGVIKIPKALCTTGHDEIDDVICN